MSELVRLDTHTNARNQAVATTHIKAGSIILTNRAFVTAVLPSQKGIRCDECFKVASEECQLRRCQACASYWYCSSSCQTAQWNTHHKKLCKNWNTFTASDLFQSLEAHQKMDAILLAHFTASSRSTGNPARGNLKASDEDIFFDLLPGPDLGSLPPTPKFKSSITSPEPRDIYARFSNNNFTIHSHFNSIGHGVFPIASRLFNHSCVPNAAAKYRLSPSSPVRMEVVALQDIALGEQICIPYVDPALTETREKIFDLTYGFKCDCVSCEWLRTLGRIAPPPTQAEEIRVITDLLLSTTHVHDVISSGTIAVWGPPRKIPRRLSCVLNESFMTSISEDFSKASHEGSSEAAMNAGITLTALYLLIYPRNYPQIGLHLLELAKVAWNKLATEEVIDPNVKSNANSFLSLAEEILHILGPEGDEGGPLEEISTLKTLLNAD